LPIPTRTMTLNTFVSSTAEHRRRDLVDNFFGSAPVWAMLKKRKAVPLRGGEVIKVSHIYAGMPAGSYGRGDEFGTEVTEFATTLVFNWKFCRSEVNLNVIDVELNDSPEQVFDLVEAAMENGELSLIDEMSDQLYGDGTGNSNKDLDGLAIAVSRTGTYGGLARGTDSQGSSIRAAVEDTAGGTLALATLNGHFGTCTVGRKKPDLLTTTQTLWNRIWERSQPSEQNKPSAMRDIGFEAVRFNGADVTVDSHVPSGFIYLLNTEFFQLFVHRKWDMRFRGFMEPAQQQIQIGQLIAWCNLVCRGPRFQGVLSGLS